MIHNCINLDTIDWSKKIDDFYDNKKHSWKESPGASPRIFPANEFFHNDEVSLASVIEDETPAVG